MNMSIISDHAYGSFTVQQYVADQPGSTTTWNTLMTTDMYVEAFEQTLVTYSFNPFAILRIKCIVTELTEAGNEVMLRNDLCYATL